MLWLLTASFRWLGSFFRSRPNLALEVLALRQQLIVLQRRSRRPRLQRSDRWFWVLPRRVWPQWTNSLLIVKPETVIGWHREAFRLYWRFRSRNKKAGRPSTSGEIRTMIARMAHENPTWGAPRIHGELLKLGVQVSERAVSRCLCRLRRNGSGGQRWRTFLKNHQDAITGMDFFTVITLNFRILYGLFLIRHDHRQILHFNCTEHPTQERIVQQLRELPGDADTQYLLFDRDAKFSAQCSISWTHADAPVRTSYQSPWQNGIAERWVRSFRNELLDGVIVLDERHLRCIGQAYIRYYHHDRTHDGLDKDTPMPRYVARKNDGEQLESAPRLGGLHHRYYWAKAA